MRDMFIYTNCISVKIVRAFHFTWRISCVYVSSWNNFAIIVIILNVLLKAASSKGTLTPLHSSLSCAFIYDLPYDLCSLLVLRSFLSHLTPEPCLQLLIYNLCSVNAITSSFPLPYCLRYYSSSVYSFHQFLTMHFFCRADFSRSSPYRHFKRFQSFSFTFVKSTFELYRTQYFIENISTLCSSVHRRDYFLSSWFYF